MGASGAIYGLYGVLYLDLFFNWPMLNKPWQECFFLTVQVIIALGIGLLPVIDNFAHIGGFFTGLLAGCLLLPKIYYSKADRMRKNILVFVSIPLLVGLFTYGFVNFYSSYGANECSWCKYLDCIPPNDDWCKNEQQ